MDKKLVLALVVIAFLAAALIFSGAFSKENTRDSVNPVGVNPIPTSVTGLDTSASVSNWTLQSIDLGDNISEKTSSYEVKVNGCASPETRTFTCFAQTGGDITYRFSFEGKTGSELFGGTFAISPEVQSSISQIQGHSDSSQKTVELGFIDTIRVTDFQIVKAGYGLFQDNMGQAITHNLRYFTGGCALTVEVIKREVCEGVEQAEVETQPTPQPVDETNQPTQQSAQTPESTVSILEIFDGTTAQNNGFENWLDLNKYCLGRPHERQAVLISQDAYGWRCETENGYLHEMNLYDACIAQYGDDTTPEYGDFFDPYSWYCHVRTK